MAKVEAYLCDLCETYAIAWDNLWWEVILDGEDSTKKIIVCNDCQTRLARALRLDIIRACDLVSYRNEPDALFYYWPKEGSFKTWLKDKW